MQSILEELIQPLTLKDFIEDYYLQKPFASPFRASQFRKLLSWPLLTRILESDHDDCWLAKSGRLTEETDRDPGHISPEEALQGFQDGKTLLIRHAEKKDPELGEIADDFFGVFGLPVDIQVYATPAGHEGFNWHYDAEDVFVIQSVGEKEFCLKPNTVNPYPIYMPKNLDFRREKSKIEIRCWLKEGDWLYIPKGYWHKARAITDSFHLSVGVLNQLPQGFMKDLLLQSRNPDHMI